MTILRRIMIATLAIALVAIGGARATSTTNFSDQWWAVNESGWALSVQQQSDVLFISLLTYATDGKPTWFTATAPLQPGPNPGHAVFIGDLYLTTGTSYAGQWDPKSLGYRKVGTLQFAASAPENASLTYTVDGTTVTKSLIRQTWRYENLAGTYRGGWNADRPFCIEGPANQTRFDDALTITIARNSDNTVTVKLDFADGGSESFSGTYTQSGHLGRIDGEFAGYGQIFVTEIEVTSAGFTGRFAGHLITSRWRDWCDMTNGRIGGVLR